VHFPAGERTTYTAAAVLLAADALSGASPAADLFVPGQPTRRSTRSEPTASSSTNEPDLNAGR